jgi:hypothetical protein
MGFVIFIGVLSELIDLFLWQKGTKLMPLYIGPPGPL